MITLNEGTSATGAYRETSAMAAINFDSTAGTGNLLEVMRNSVIVIYAPSDLEPHEKVPSRPEGDFDAYTPG